MLQHAKALLILLAFAVLLVLGTPGLDYQEWRRYDDADELDEARDRFGALGGPLVRGISIFNGRVRQPIYDRLEILQRPLRARQSWHLYRDGPNRVRRIEIRVDDQLIHRSADPDFAWRAPQLRNRHLRPVVQNVTTKPDSPNWRGLARWVVAQARRDFPDAERVDIVARVGRFPGTELADHHRYVAEAPDWIPHQQGAD